MISKTSIHSHLGERQSIFMDWRESSLILIFASLIFCGVASSTTSPDDTASLQAVKASLIDHSRSLSNWTGDDPCGAGWAGVYCVPSDYPNDSVNGGINGSYLVTELRLLHFNLEGSLAPEIGNFPALKYLNLMWNNLSGDIPSTIGNLQNLEFLLLSGNQLAGTIPRELGLLRNLTRLQLDANRLSGPVPDTLVGSSLPNLEHVQMNNNSLTGSIPVGITTLSSVTHLILDDNRLSGSLPAQMSNMSSLLTVHLANNEFDAGSTIPKEYGTMAQLITLSLRNCNLGGPLPNFSRASSLSVLDLSQNSLTGSISSAGLNSITNLTSLDLSYNNLSGNLPDYLSSFSALRFLELRGNQFSGQVPRRLSIDRNTSTVVDVQDNSITSFADQSDLLTLERQAKGGVWLSGNPICNRSSPSFQSAAQRLCMMHNVTAALDTGEVRSLISPDPSECPSCSPPSALYPTSEGQGCRCAVPINVQGRLESPSFVIFDPYFQDFSNYLASSLWLSSDQVQFQSYVYQPGPRFLYTVRLFPAGNMFNDEQKAAIYGILANSRMPSSNLFGPYELVSFTAPTAAATGGGKGSSQSSGLSNEVIVAIVVAVLVFVVLKTLCIYYLLRYWILRRKSKSPTTWDSRSWGKYSGKKLSNRKSLILRRGNSSIKVAGVKEFSFGEIVKATDDFRIDRLVGEGGYGKVYSGMLDGKRVAVKRAEEGSHQGLREFETEIQLLSRVHHRNLVGLIGYCNDEGEQVLVYEFIAHGSLQQHLTTAESRIPLNFLTRLQIALDSARGIHYLHTEADPPIFHRDIKASNILLDEMFHARVSDFGLSKLAPRPDLEGTMGYVSTVVKGTPGYLDPEYFKTHRLTDKSDVYSFGVVILVLVTGAQPITEGKNVVREVSAAFGAGELYKVVDFRIRGSYPHRAMQTLVAVALASCKDNPDERPCIGDVLARLERLWQETYSNAADDGAHDPSLGELSITTVTTSGELREYSRSENSFIEGDPSKSSSVQSSTVWTSSGKQSGNSKEDMGSIKIVNPR